MRNRFVSVKFCFKRKNETFLDFQPLCHFLKLLTMPIISFENQFEIIAISYFFIKTDRAKKEVLKIQLKNVSYYATNN